MPNPDDNVVPMPTMLERLASRASQAMNTYKAGRHEAVHAILDYGAALSEGRALHPKGDNAAFARWVAANRLDVGTPWNLQQERGSAMLLATLVLHAKIHLEDLANCPRTRPNDVRNWVRKHVLGQAPKPRASAKKIARANEELRKMAAADLPITGPALAERAGVGETTALKAIALAAKAQEATTVATAATVQTMTKVQTLASATFTEKGKLRIEDAIRIHQERLSKAFETRVNDEVRRRILAADDAARTQLREANRKLLAFEMERGKKGVFTKTEYRQMIMLCHPDNSASEATRAHLLDLLVKNEVRLVRD